jgi:hypothetical protein
VPAARRAGGVDEALNLLFGPIPRADPRCGSQEMVKSLLDQRNCWIIAAAVEQTLQSDQPDFSRGARLLDSKIPRGAHEGGRLDREVPRARHRHASTRTTQLYDRRRAELSLDEVERIVI